MSMRIPILAAASALALTSCTTTETYSRPVGGGYYAARPRWHRDGRVESIRETVRRTEGNPVGGAAAGAVVGGLLGGAVTGHGGGAAVGAIGGAATGAAVSQGRGEERYYEVYVRYDDGDVGRFVYRGMVPWRVGDRVRQTPRGLRSVGPGTAAVPPPPPPPPDDVPPPPDASPPDLPPSPGG